MKRKIPNVVFARTKHHYDSYTDFWRLVELAGFQMCWVDQIDLEKANTVYITTPFTGDTKQHLGHRRSLIHDGINKAQVVWWNLERPDSQYYEPGEEVRKKVQAHTDHALCYVDKVWVSDRHYASLDDRLQFVVMGSDAALDPGTPADGSVTASYDFCHFSYEDIDRRKRIYNTLRSRRVTLAPNGWGNVRHTLLRNSRGMLNVHQTPYPVGEPLRFALAAAYKMPLLTEHIIDPHPLVPGTHCSMGDYDSFTDAVDDYVKLEGWWDAMRTCGDMLHHLLCYEHPFKLEVLKGIHEAYSYIG